MDLDTFEAHAERMWDAIPPHFRAGIQAVIIEPEPKPDPLYAGTWLMGECMADPAASMVPDGPLRSLIWIYHGSFVQIAQNAVGGFDWEGELWETLTHELRHHLEWAAGVDYLGDEDDVQAENLARLQGMAFDVDFYRRGARMDDGVYVADGELFLEVKIPRRQWAATLADGMEIEWGGVRCDIPAGLTQANSAVIFVEPAINKRLGRLPWRAINVVLRRKIWW